MRGRRMMMAAAAPLQGDAYESAVLADSPIAWWKLDETSGTTLADAVAANDATLSGTYTLDQSPLIQTGRAVSCDDSPVDIGAGQIVTDITADWSAECWVKFDDVADEPEIFGWEIGTNGEFLSVRSGSSG